MSSLLWLLLVDGGGCGQKQIKGNIAATNRLSQILSSHHQSVEGCWRVCEISLKSSGFCGSCAFDDNISHWSLILEIIILCRSWCFPGSQSLSRAPIPELPFTSIQSVAWWWLAVTTTSQWIQDIQLASKFMGELVFRK